MAARSLVWAVCFSATAVNAISTEYDLTGFPANSYDPVCATACLRCLYTMMLDCSHEGAMIGMVQLMTSTECYAANHAYLTSVAWCARTKCEDVDPSPVLMEYWFVVYG